MKTTVQPTAPSFVVGEAVMFRLTLQNTAPQPLTIADPLLNEVDPLYAVTGPDGQVTHVRLLSARAHDPRIEPMAPPAVITMDLPASGSWSEEMALDPMLLLTAPGKYSLTATLSAGGKAVVSPPASFTMEAAHVVAFGAAGVPPKTLESRLFTAWAHAGPSGAQIVEAVRLDRVWGDDRRGKLYSNTLVRGISGAVSSVATAEPVFVAGMDFHGWVAWTEPGAVSAIRSNAGKPEGAAEVVHRPSGAAALVGPLAMDRSYGARMYLVEQGASGAELVRVDVPRAAPGGAKVVWRARLPFAPEAGIALHAVGQASVIVVAGKLGGSAVVGAVEDDSTPSYTEVRRLGPWIAGRPLAARRAEDGSLVLACLSASGEDPHKARLFSAVLGPGLAVKSESTTDVAGLDPGEVRWASVGVGVSGEHLVYRASGGELHHRPPGGHDRALHEPMSDTPVPEILTGDGQGFLSGVRKDGAFTIEPLSPEGHHH